MLSSVGTALRLAVQIREWALILFLLFLVYIDKKDYSTVYFQDITCVQCGQNITKIVTHDDNNCDGKEHCFLVLKWQTLFALPGDFLLHKELRGNWLTAVLTP